MIPPLNTDTLQLSNNSTLPLFRTNCNISQLPNIVDISRTNQAMEKKEAQLIAMKSYIKCEISNIDQKIKSSYECFNGVKETEKSSEMIQKNVTLFPKRTNKKR